MDISHMHDTISVYSCILTSYVSNVDKVRVRTTFENIVFVWNTEYSFSLKVRFFPFYKGLCRTVRLVVLYDR